MRTPTTAEQSELSYYLSLDQDTLWIFLGRTLQTRKGVQLSPESARRQAKKWFEQLEPQLRRAICVEWQYCKERHKNRLQDHVTLGVTVADLIASLCGGVPVFMVASLIISMGLDKFCKCK